MKYGAFASIFLLYFVHTDHERHADRLLLDYREEANTRCVSLLCIRGMRATTLAQVFAFLCFLFNDYERKAEQARYLSASKVRGKCAALTVH